MLINSLKLNNYRNYKNKYLEFSPHLNIILGENGVGKTNILESLLVVSNTKSFRTLNDRDLIKKGEQYSKIECLNNFNKYKVVISDNGKKLYFNDVLVKRTSEYIGKLNCVLFKPSDLNLFNDSPKDRRRLLDIEIGKTNKQYLSNLLEYNLLLKDKNKLLKEEKIDLNYLEILEAKMLTKMEIIIKTREDFFNIINKYLNDYYFKIANDNLNLKVSYKKCSEVDNLKENLLKSHEKDIFYHYTTFGIHHEDYYFYTNDERIEVLASQGQTRMILIAFKLALKEYIKEKINDVPILLLDDILSELDISNRERLLNIIPKDTQVIITGTDLKGINIKENFNLIEIKEDTNV